MVEAAGKGEVEPTNTCSKGSVAHADGGIKYVRGRLLGRPSEVQAVTLAMFGVAGSSGP